MIDQRCIILAVFLLFTSSLFAQEDKSKQFVAQKELSRAEAMKATDPNAAIKIIESFLRQKRKKKNRNLEAEAYMLLGDIYMETGQQDGAKERYEQAALLLGEINAPHLRVRNYSTLGNLYLDEGNIKLAHENFSNCLRMKASQSTLMKCEVGMANLDFVTANYERSLEKYNAILDKHTPLLDSLTLAKIEARKTQIFVAQKRLPEARLSYNSSQNSFPNSYPVLEKDYVVIEEATDSILNNTKNIEDKIQLRQENLDYKQNRNFSSNAIISEQLELADLYLEKGEVKEAEKYVNASKSLVEKEVDPEQKARVFKKSSEVSKRRGALREAVEDFSNYTSASEKTIEKKERELKNKIKILRNQSNIDILEKDAQLEEKEALLLQNQIETQKLLIGFLAVLLLAALISFYFIMKNVRAKRKANTLLLLKSLRTQMNPHFIFNALNSVNNYIARNDERAANKFLTKFSRLMRMVLDYSQKDFIPFEDEMQLIELYLDLEHSRFRDKFDFTIEKKGTDDFVDVEIPPMLIQPFIENAVWHGLRYKTGKGHLKLSIRKTKDAIEIVIEDDGIGREKSKAIKTKNQKKYRSTGMKNVDKRIALVNEIYGKNYKIEVTDLLGNVEEPGTRVKIKL